MSAIEVLESRRLLADFSPLSFGGGGYDGDVRLAVAEDGTVYAAGLFSGTADFRAGPRDVTLTARGDTDIFVARYTPGGFPLWVRQFGGGNTEDELEDPEDIDRSLVPDRLSLTPGPIGTRPEGVGEYVNDVALDADGNLFVAADFVGTGLWGDRVLRSVDPEFYDAVVMKLTPDGDVAFLSQYGGRFDDTALSIAVDPAGNPVVGGSFARTADFDPRGGAFVFPLEAKGREDGYVATFSGTDGALAAVAAFGGDADEATGRDAVNAVAVDDAGHIYAAGTFADEVDFDPGPGEFDLDAEGDTDAFALRMSSDYALDWAVATGGEDGDGNLALATSPDGAVVVAGYFSDEADVVPGPGVAVLEAVESDDENPDALVSKLSAETGELVWVGHVAGEGIELVTDLGVADNGAITLVGGFFGSADFAPGRAEVVLRSVEAEDDFRDFNARDRDEQSYDGFALTLSPSGRLAAVAQFAGNGDDFVTAAALDPLRGKLYLGGLFGSKLEDDERARIDLNPGPRRLPLTSDDEAQGLLFTVDPLALGLV